jgi:hypothetical protein
MDAEKIWRGAASGAETPVGLACLIGVHIITCCVSLVCVSAFQYPNVFSAAGFHIFYDAARLPGAIAVIAAFALVSVVFVFARFSIGYFIGFYFYTMVLGYLWINFFSDLDYDHRLFGLSAAASAVAFLVPALLIGSPIRQVSVPSPSTFELLLALILLFSLVTIVAGGIHNFRLVAVADIYLFRTNIEFPKLTSYALAITSSTLLPFAFACFVARRNHWRAAAALLLLLLLYPVTLSKLSLFAPAWLLLMAVLARVFGARTSVILSLLLPTMAGLMIFTLDTWPRYFYVFNFRMLAVPSSAMDIYSHYFAGHDLTHFCQIGILKALMSCPYQEQLSIVMQRAYGLGNFNASLFATEGIASVGPLLAPVAVFACGLAIAFANRLSAGLPPQFILTSGALMPPVLLNVPFSVSLVTHGAALLFLLWYFTPRTMFEPNSGRAIPGPAVDDQNTTA